MRYLHGTGKLQAFIEAYENGSPPLLLSNGFPCNLLPKPITMPPPVDTDLPLEKQREQFQQNKRVKDVKYLTQADFIRSLNGEVVSPLAESDPPQERRITLKNQLNRLSSTTGEEGTLYNFEEYYWPEVTIYLKIVDEFVDQAQQLFMYIANTGYGKRKSIGYGQIGVENFSFEPFSGFNSPPGSNGFVSLSDFVPASSDPTTGAWQTIVKYGKMGEEYASEDSVFKKPLIMLEAGSTFYDSPCREYYGRLVRNLNPAYPEAVQYAFALPVSIILPRKPD
jgi:CRISPR-associated protein Csm4